MRPGETVLVTRGLAKNMRTMLGTVVAIDGYEVIVRLEQNDPKAQTGYCTRKGDVGRWNKNFIRSIKEV